MSYQSTQILLPVRPAHHSLLSNFIQQRNIALPPLEKFDVVIKVKYVSLDPSLKPFLCETNHAHYCPPPFMCFSKECTHGEVVCLEAHKIPTKDGTIDDKSGSEKEISHVNLNVLSCHGVGEVVESKNRYYTIGANVFGNFGLQSYFFASGGKDLDGNFLRDITLDTPLSAFLTLSKAGLCAYFAVTELADLKREETVFITGGSGSVGSFVSQICKARESSVKVYGFASTDEKCRLMKEKLQYDGVINYCNYCKDSSSEVVDSEVYTPISPPPDIFSSEFSPVTPLTPPRMNFSFKKDPHQRHLNKVEVHKAIKEMCPNGIDVVIDTVGGPMLDICLGHINMNARIVLCGAISYLAKTGYTFKPPKNYTNLILKCARMEGFVLEKFSGKFKKANQQLVKWIQEGKLENMEDNLLEVHLDDKEEVVRAFEQLFIGNWVGKLVLRVLHNPVCNIAQ
ncbi:hypothetical protein ABK040_003646 [Willaertia magna]